MIKQEPKISIVMPVHNTGKLLYDSIGSLLAQTFSDIEMICVDDGSDDELTKRILTDYKAIDKRIDIVFCDSNMGAGAARNVGMKKAVGKYIIFFDSDDYAYPDMLESMYLLCEKYQLDFCTCCSYTVDAANKGYISSFFYKEKPGITDSFFSVGEIGEEALSYWDTAPWNKLIRRSFICDHEIEFQNLTSCNDVFFTVMCAMKAKRIMYCRNGEPLVEYRMGRKEQISLNRKPSNIKLAFELLKEKLNDLSYYEERIVLAELIYLARGELAAEASENEKKILYAYVKNYVCEEVDIECIESEPIKRYCKLFKDNPFESGWFEEKASQNANIDVVLEDIDLKKPIIIWGYGRNGRALDKALNLVKINTAFYVADRKNLLVGRETMYGTPIIATNDALIMDASILATNAEIYDYLFNYSDKRCCMLKKGY